MLPAPLPSGPPSLTDIAAVEAAIRQRVGRRVIGLVVSVEGGAITLNGLADCYYTKQLVVAAVLALPGYRLGANRIRVESKLFNHQLRAKDGIDRPSGP